MSITQQLMEQIQGITSNGIEIMNGREKGDIETLIDETIVVNGYDFGVGQDGSEYVAFTITDNDTEFFFGSSVVTENFKSLDNMLSEEQKEELLKTGLPMSLHQKKSKNNRKYTYNVFFPNK